MSRSIAIIHRSFINGLKPEHGLIAIGEQAADKYEAINRLYNIEAQITQVGTGTVQPAVETVGIEQPPVQAIGSINVALVHRRGTFKHAEAKNEPGDDSPAAVLEKLILSFNTQDLVSWVQENA